jgi:hypothetical protein
MSRWYDNVSMKDVCLHCNKGWMHHHQAWGACPTFTNVSGWHPINAFIHKVPGYIKYCWIFNCQWTSVCDLCQGIAGLDHTIGNGTCLDKNRNFIYGQFFTMKSSKTSPDFSVTTHSSTGTKKYDPEQECPCGLRSAQCDYHRS